MGHQPVTELLKHMAVKIDHGCGSLVEIRVDEVAPIFRVEPRREVRRADEVAEHHRNRSTLRRNLKAPGRCGLGRGGKRVHRWGWARQRDCGETPSPTRLAERRSVPLPRRSPPLQLLLDRGSLDPVGTFISVGGSRKRRVWPCCVTAFMPPRMPVGATPSIVCLARQMRPTGWNTASMT